MTFHPYQEMEEELEKRNNAPGKILKNAVTLGSSFAGGSSIVNRLLPLLNSHVPEEIAKKGIAKVSPHLGKFIESASSLGHDFYEIRDFIRGKAAEEDESTKVKRPEENKNILQQYSPELHEFIAEEINKGRPTLEAGALAFNQPRFKEAITKLTKDHKASFADILQTIFGEGASERQTKNRQSEMSREGLQQQFQQGQMQQPGQPQQGKGNLAQTMRDIKEGLRNMRGNG